METEKLSGQLIITISSNEKAKEREVKQLCVSKVISGHLKKMIKNQNALSSRSKQFEIGKQQNKSVKRKIKSSKENLLSKNKSVLTDRSTSLLGERSVSARCRLAHHKSNFSNLIGAKKANERSIESARINSKVQNHKT